MSSIIPSLNLSKAITDQYNRVNDLKNSNASTEALGIDYNRLDTKTKGMLKDSIASAIVNYKKYDMYPETKEYLDQLFKQNMGTSFTIEYKKLKDDLCDINVEGNLRETIQLVLINRARELYLDMTLNPTV